MSIRIVENDEAVMKDNLVSKLLKCKSTWKGQKSLYIDQGVV